MFKLPLPSLAFMKTRWLAALLGLGLLGFAVEAQPVTSLELGAAETSSGVRKSKRTAHDRAARQQVFALRTGTVTVEGRWMNSFSLPLKTGDVLTPEKLSAAMEFLEAAITRETVQGFGLRSLGEVGVLYIDVDFSTNAPAADRVVDVTFRPYYVRFSLVKLGDNVLPIPRSAFPTLYENVPAPLLALKPTVDRKSVV